MMTDRRTLASTVTYKTRQAYAELWESRLGLSGYLSIFPLTFSELLPVVMFLICRKKILVVIGIALDYWLMLTGTEKGSGVQQRIIHCCTPLPFSVVGLDPLRIQTDNGSGLLKMDVVRNGGRRRQQQRP